MEELYDSNQAHVLYTGRIMRLCSALCAELSIPECKAVLCLYARRLEADAEAWEEGSFWLEEAKELDPDELDALMEALEMAMEELRGQILLRKSKAGKTGGERKGGENEGR